VISFAYREKNYDYAIDLAVKTAKHNDAYTFLIYYDNNTTSLHNAETGKELT